ncbi:hypothetical protein [Halomarina pelagica]|uniref:hypothetical protein n=1 Tax=Halomarina pelagica TaxID=2961599 RepID=UPI0020C4C4B1|nr:hypothetical protein [Halomarina sp. BND7]
MRSTQRPIVGFLFGDSARTTAAFLLVAALAAAAVVAVGSAIPIGAYVAGSDVADAVGVTLLVGFNAFHAYRNRGLAACVVLASVVLFGLFVGGAIGLSAPPGWTPTLGDYLQIALGFGLVFGSAGFVAGYVVRFVSGRVRRS